MSEPSERAMRLSMRSHHDSVAAMLGAWALDACDNDERRIVTAHLTTCADCSSEAALLRTAADSFTTDVDRSPPSVLRTRVLDAARGIKPVRAGVCAPYAAEVDKLDQLLSALTDHEWAIEVFNGWSVRDVMLHLSVTDAVFAEQIGLRDPTSQDGVSDGLVERTEAAIVATRDVPSSDLRHDWRNEADALCRFLNGQEYAELERTIEWIGSPMTVHTVLLDRAFETWIHADDIRSVLGRPVDPPSAEHLHELASTAIRFLPMAVQLVSADQPAGDVRVILEGPGGGEWVVPLAEPPSTSISAELVLDALEFCYLVGGRRTPDRVGAVVTGDAAIAATLLQAAAALSRP